MYCSSCGTQVPDGHSFCSKCGKPAAGSTKTSALTIVIRVVGVLTIAFLAFVFLERANRSTNTPSDDHTSFIAHMPVVVHRTEPIMPGTLVIPPLHFQVLDININPQMQ